MQMSLNFSKNLSLNFKKKQLYLASLLFDSRKAFKKAGVYTCEKKS